MTWMGCWKERGINTVYVKYENVSTRTCETSEDNQKPECLSPNPKKRCCCLYLAEPKSASDQKSIRFKKKKVSEASPGTARALTVQKKNLLPFCGA